MTRLTQQRLVETLRKRGTLTETDEVQEQLVDRIEPRFAEDNVVSQVHPDLQAALQALDRTELYEHQAEAVQAALRGKNVVLESPPASGKTLAFQIPILDTLLRDPSAKALMIYPTKALAKDQEQQLTDLTNNLPGREIRIAAFDGDTPKAVRDAIKENPPQILRTNPDMLHYSFLGWAEQHEEFLRNIRWIVIDEVHEYRGYFGSNVALILRRLLHHLRQKYGVTPNIFMCSATCKNAKAHAEKLTGLKFESVDGSEALRPQRDYSSVQLDAPDSKYWDVLREKTVEAALECLAADLQVLVFCPTRIFAEECKRQVDQQLRRGSTRDAIQVYKGGLSVIQREEIQAGLQSGEVRLAFATNALELGINIGGLDGVIMAGFPNDMMSARQQLGRAGRHWQSDAFVLYLPRNNPLDRYFASNIHEFTEGDLHDLMVNPDNEVLVARHVRCALHETPEFNGGKDLLGAKLYQAVMEKRDSYRRSGRNRPHFGVDIRGGGSTSFELKVGRRDIGTMSGNQQFREAYEDAIYLHGGEAYRVDSVTTKRNRPGTIHLNELSDGEQYLRTIPKIFASISGETPYDGHRWTTAEGQIDVLYGQVTVTERIYVIEEIDERTQHRQRSWQPENSSSFWDGEGIWIEFDENFAASAPALLAFEQMLRIGSLLTILADESDVVAQAAGRARTAYLVESYEGGIGIATQALNRWQVALMKGIEVAENCTVNCRDGCPRCIVPPRVKDLPDKQGGLRLAAQILEATAKPHDHVLVNDFWEPAQGRLGSG